MHVHGTARGLAALVGRRSDAIVGALPSSTRPDVALSVQNSCAEKVFVRRRA